MRELAVLFGTLMVGCPGPGGADAGSTDAHVEPELEIGTGEGAFTPFADGETLTIIRGTQGAQHVWVALRTQGLDPRGNLVELDLRRDTDDMMVSSAYRIRASFIPQESFAELTGLTCVIPDPDLVLGQALTLHVSVSDMQGKSVSGARPLRAAWSP